MTHQNKIRRQRLARVYSPRQIGKKRWAVAFWPTDDAPKRKFAFFSSEGEARQFAKGLNDEKTLPIDYQLSISDRQNALKLVSMMKREKWTWEMLFESIERAGATAEISLNLAVEKISGGGFDLGTCVTAYIADCKARGLRPNTIAGYSQQLNALPSLSLSQEDAEKILNNYHSKSSKTRVLAVAKKFFDWLIQKGWAQNNPFVGVSLKGYVEDKKGITVIPPDSLRGVFAKLKGTPIAPVIALLAFAGIRPLEAVRYDKTTDALKSGDIDFERKQIHIRAGVAKTRAERHLQNLPVNLWAWLEPLKSMGAGEYIFPTAYQNFRVQLRDKKIELEHDILRHSFASNSYWKFGLEATLDTLGHVADAKVFQRHYKGLSSPELAEKYFSITPDTV